MINGKRQLVNNKLSKRGKAVAQQIRAGCEIHLDKKQQPIK
jgi:hypothetical protein